MENYFLNITQIALWMQNFLEIELKNHFGCLSDVIYIQDKRESGRYNGGGNGHIFKADYSLFDYFGLKLFRKEHVKVINILFNLLKVFWMKTLSSNLPHLTQTPN